MRTQYIHTTSYVSQDDSDVQAEFRVDLGLEDPRLVSIAVNDWDTGDDYGLAMLNRTQATELRDALSMALSALPE